MTRLLPGTGPRSTPSPPIKEQADEKGRAVGRRRVCPRNLATDRSPEPSRTLKPDAERCTHSAPSQEGANVVHPNSPCRGELPESLVTVSCKVRSPQLRDRALRGERKSSNLFSHLEDRRHKMPRYRLPESQQAPIVIDALQATGPINVDWVFDSHRTSTKGVPEQNHARVGGMFYELSAKDVLIAKYMNGLSRNSPDWVARLMRKAV